MKGAILVALAMTAFAANSILNRAAVGGLSMGAFDFAVLRLWSGAVVLACVVLVLRRRVAWVARGRAAGVFGLLVYLGGFSWAYQDLDAGAGALILFGCVQITMFAGALWGGERPRPRRWIGAGIALAGLAWLLWPSDASAISPWHGAAMAAAGVGWGGYSLAGLHSSDALAGTAANFLLGAPFALLLFVVPAGLEPSAWTPAGVALAVVSGGIASALGYALWYAVLPRLDATAAAVAQLSVPIIAAAGGVVLLAEPVTMTFALAAMIVLGGVAVAVTPPRR